MISEPSEKGPELAYGDAASWPSIPLVNSAKGLGAFRGIEGGRAGEAEALVRCERSRVRVRVDTLLVDEESAVDELGAPVDGEVAEDLRKN